MSNHDDDKKHDDGPPPDSFAGFASETMDLRRRGVIAAEKAAAHLANIEQMLRDIGFPPKRKHRPAGSGGFNGGGG